MPRTPIYFDDRLWGKSNRFGQAHVPSLRRNSPVAIEFDEGLLPSGTSATRRASLLPVPGAFYGIGEKYRTLERSYRLLVGNEQLPIDPGVLVRDEAGAIIGTSGHDGIVTLSGRPGTFVFEQPERTCQGTYTGEEVGDYLATIYADCETAFSLSGAGQ